MGEEKLWSIVEFVLRDLDLPHPLLISLILSLPFPVKPKPPPHIRRLFFLRHLLSATASHRLLSPLTLMTLERLLPSPPSPPSSSLCTAYSSHLFYLSTSPGFSVEVTAVLSRLNNYCFAMMLLEPWRAMIARQEKIRSGAIDRVVSARDKAIFALKDFVDEEFRAMEPPFLTRCIQESCRENQEVASLAPSKKSDGAMLKETEAIQGETLPTKTSAKQVDGTSAPSKKSDKGATQNEIEVNERGTLPTKNGAKQVDGTSTPSRKSDKGATQNENKANERGTLPTKSGAKEVDDTCTPSKKSDKGATQKETQANQTEISPTKTCAKQANGTCTSASTNTSTNAISGEREQDMSKENGKKTVRNANDASTSHANTTNIERNNHVPEHRFMDRNPTAHAFEWNDSIDCASQMEKAQTGMRSGKTRQLENPRGRAPKRRQKIKWQPEEEEALRKAVNEFGKGNWKEILENYPNEFVGRNAVDLKDKWRNMTRY